MTDKDDDHRDRPSSAGSKLDRTRLAIIEHVHRGEKRHERQKPQRREHDAPQEGEQWEAAEAAAASGGGGVAHGLQRALRSWWRHHPARAGLDFATPMLSAYAQKHPAQYLGIAAAAGAVFMVARPWRLISVTGILVALLKSPQLASVVMSAMSSRDPDEGLE